MVVGGAVGRSGEERSCVWEGGCGGLVLQIELFEPFEYFGPEYVANKLVPGWISYPAGTLTVKLDTGNRSMEHK